MLNDDIVIAISLIVSAMVVVTCLAAAVGVAIFIRRRRRAIQQGGKPALEGIPSGYGYFQGNPAYYLDAPPSYDLSSISDALPQNRL